jgi:hypothetical protein
LSKQREVLIPLLNKYGHLSVVFRAGWGAREERHRLEVVNHRPNEMRTKDPQNSLKVTEMPLSLLTGSSATVRTSRHHAHSLSQNSHITINPEIRLLILLLPKKSIFFRNHHSPPLLQFLPHPLRVCNAIFHTLFLTYYVRMAQPKV